MPFAPSSLLLLLLAVLSEIVREAVDVAVGEDARHVGEEVVRGESDELLPTKKHLAEQVVGIEAVGEDGAVACRRRAGMGTQFLEAKHPRRARREVVKARTEEPLGKVTSTPLG